MNNRIISLFLLILSLLASERAAEASQAASLLFPSQAPSSETHASWLSTLLGSGHTPQKAPDFNLVLQILDAALELHSSSKPLLDRKIDSPASLVIAGDIHGVWDDVIYGALQKAKESEGKPIHLLFLGDYVDRGRHSVEVMTLLLALQLTYPERVTLLRGNHETREINLAGGFWQELCAKYGAANGVVLYEKFNQVFDHLPFIARVRIGGTYFAMMHGGITPSLDLEKLVGQEFTSEIAQAEMPGVLWNDPYEGIDGFIPSRRGGVFQFFGIKQVHDFCRRNGLAGIVRGHQYLNQGCRCMKILPPPSQNNDPSEASDDDARLLATVHGASLGGKKLRFGSLFTIESGELIRVENYELPNPEERAFSPNDQKIKELSSRASEEFRAHQYPNSAQTLSELALLYPQLSEAYLSTKDQQINILMKGGYNAEAIQEAESLYYFLSASFPVSELWLFNAKRLLAFAFAAAKQYDKAISLIEPELDNLGMYYGFNSPQFLLTTRELGLFYAKAGRAQKAIDFLLPQLLNLKQTFRPDQIKYFAVVEHQLALSSAYFALGNYEEQVRLLEEAISWQEANRFVAAKLFTGYMNRADGYRKLGDPLKALTQLKQLAKRFESERNCENLSYIEVLETIGETYAEIAGADLEQLPSSHESHHRFFKSQNWLHSAATYAKVLRLYNKNPQLYGLAILPPTIKSNLEDALNKHIQTLTAAIATSADYDLQNAYSSMNPLWLKLSEFAQSTAPSVYPEIATAQLALALELDKTQVRHELHELLQHMRTWRAKNISQLHSRLRLEMDSLFAKHLEASQQELSRSHLSPALPPTPRLPTSGQGLTSFPRLPSLRQ